VVTNIAKATAPIWLKTQEDKQEGMDMGCAGL